MASRIRNDGAGGDAAPVRTRRVRRSRDEVVALIEQAARELFAERGYNAATTREIAQRADVSETLLFRHFTDKATLFEATVSAPFDTLMTQFLARRAHDAGDAQRMFEQVYELLEGERELLSAMLAGAVDREGAGHGAFQSFLSRAVESQRANIEQRGASVPFDVEIGVRLAFGMMVSAAVMQDWLFPEGVPPKHRMVDTIRAMVEGAFDPRQTD